MELQMLNAIQSIRTPLLDGLMTGITRTGDLGAIWCILALVLLARKKTRYCGVALVLAIALDLVVCNIGLKHLIGRVRPCDVNTVIQLLIARPTDPSFPSGHTTASFTAVAVLFFCGYRKSSVLAGVWACLIAFSRMYLYVHYPTDILGGIVCGVALGFCSVKLLAVMKKRYVRERGQQDERGYSAGV